MLSPDLGADFVVDTFSWNIYQGDDLYMELVDPDGADPQPWGLAHIYLHGPAIDQILADTDYANGKIHWGLADHQGTIRDVVEYNAATSTTDLEHQGLTPGLVSWSRHFPTARTGGSRPANAR